MQTEKSVTYALPGDYVLTVDDPMLRDLSHDQRETLVREFSEFQSHFKTQGFAERWSFSFFLSYDSKSGWSFGLSIGMEF